jgi:hypothetical protein
MIALRPTQNLERLLEPHLVKAGDSGPRHGRVHEDIQASPLNVLFLGIAKLENTAATKFSRK